MQWFRMEERFRRKSLPDDQIGDGYQFNFRIRCNILAQFPLGRPSFKPGSLSVVLSNKTFINAGKEFVYNTFDQSRAFAGLALHLSSHDNLQFGSMNVFLQQAAGNRFRSNYVARVFYFHNLDWQKTKQKVPAEINPPAPPL